MVLTLSETLPRCLSRSVAGQTLVLDPQRVHRIQPLRRLPGPEKRCRLRPCAPPLPPAHPPVLCCEHCPNVRLRLVLPSSSQRHLSSAPQAASCGRSQLRLLHGTRSDRRMRSCGRYPRPEGKAGDQMAGSGETKSVACSMMDGCGSLRGRGGLDGGSQQSHAECGNRNGRFGASASTRHTRRRVRASAQPHWIIHEWIYRTH